MADIYHLSFSIGPVQAFVAQARRTRDLWAGSWLLSYLAESALAAAENAGGRAIIPFRHDRDRGRVTATESAVGGMPNRFELSFSGDQAKQQAMGAADAAKHAFCEAWYKIARAVHDEFLPDDVLAIGNGSEQIWKRQVERFWELSWVVGQPSKGESTVGALAAMRKNLRNVPVSIEHGVKCSLMPTLQELSGHVGRGAGQRQQAFWNRVRRQLGGLDLGDHERLCAIALIKRLFPKVVRRAIVEDVSADLYQVAWPSTAFVAALPWLKSLNGEARNRAEQYQQAALDVGYERSEWQAARDADVGWAVADAPVWFASAIRNDEPATKTAEEDVPGSKGQAADRRPIVKRLLEQLQKVYEAAGDPSKKELSKPVPYYAMVLMDGDSMGKLLSALKSKGGPQQLSQCLDAFCCRVDSIVRDHGGRTVYAGGDDVLALLPAVHALAVAGQLREVYQRAFESQDIDKNVATISAAIVYAHWRYPLRQVLQTAHRLLEDVAKDATGRDAIVQGIILGSGLNAVWSVPWEVHFGTCRTQDHSPCVRFEEFVERFRLVELDDSPDPPFNASYLYLLREQFGYLLGYREQQPGTFLKFGDSDLTADENRSRKTSGANEGDRSRSSNEFHDARVLLRDLAHAEYRRRMSKSVRAETLPEKTEPTIDQLMSLSRRWHRDVIGSGNQQQVAYRCDHDTFTFDGWRLARFVRQIREGRVDDHD